MSMKHSLTALALCFALSPAAEALAASCSESEIQSEGFLLDSTSTIAELDNIRPLKNGNQNGYEIDEALLLHAEKARDFAKKKNADKETGFAIYSNESIKPAKYYLGKVWASDGNRYHHKQYLIDCDRQWLIQQYGGVLDDWKYQGDAHVHRKSSTVSENVRENAGNPSLGDLMQVKTDRNGEVIRDANERVRLGSGGYMNDAVTKIMMAIAFKPRLLGGYDASILERTQDDLLQRSSDVEQRITEAFDYGKPRDHDEAISILRGAFLKGNLYYYSGNLNFKKRKSTFKHRRIWPTN